MNRSQGFTLIELLLALSIFTLIGMSTVRQIQQIQNTKDTAFEELDLYNSLRAAISLMRSDLTQTFHILYEDLGNENQQAVLQNQPVPHTLFDGRKNELVFTSLSHRVYYSGLKESDQTEISYFLQRKPGAERQSFMKRESELIDGDLYQGGSIYTLLDNVEAVEFKYWNDKTARWEDDWNSDGGEFRDRFPFAVKMKLTVSGKNKKPMEISTEFKRANPNNEAYLVQF